MGVLSDKKKKKILHSNLRDLMLLGGLFLSLILSVFRSLAQSSAVLNEKTQDWWKLALVFHVDTSEGQLFKRDYTEGKKKSGLNVLNRICYFLWLSLHEKYLFANIMSVTCGGTVETFCHFDTEKVCRWSNISTQSYVFDFIVLSLTFCSSQG